MEGEVHFLWNAKKRFVQGLPSLTVISVGWEQCLFTVTAAGLAQQLPQTNFAKCLWSE